MGSTKEDENGSKIKRKWNTYNTFIHIYMSIVSLHNNIVEITQMRRQKKGILARASIILFCRGQPI